MYNIQDGGPKEKKDDRVLVLEVKDGERPLSSMGLVDPRLFQGENNIHCIKGNQDNLWYAKYDKGVLPGVLKQKFTNFKSLYNLCEEYYDKRGIRIKEVID